MTVFDRPQADFFHNPVYFVELAHEWAAGGPAPSMDHAAWLRELPRPAIPRPATAREALWGLLSYPERGRALWWLQEQELLAELLPCWAGDPLRQAQRMKAVEEVHLERWASLLSATAFDWLCVYQDQKVDGRLGGWAISGLTTLLLQGDVETDAFAALVDRDLKALDAHSGEINRVVSAIREFPALCRDLLDGKTATGRYTPNGIIAALSSVWAMDQISMDQRKQAAILSDKLLLRYAAPDAATPALFLHHS